MRTPQLTWTTQRTRTESTLNEVSAYFNRSGKRTSKFQALAKELKISQTKIVKSGKTRWLSRAGCVAVVIKLFSALVQVFTTDKNEADNEVAGVLLTSVSTYMFVAVLVAMGDFLPLLSTLSQTFQHDVIDYSTVQARLGEVRCQIIEDFLQFKDDAKQLSVDASQQEWNDAWNDQLSCDSEMFKRPTSILLSELLKEDGCFRGVELEGCTDGTQSQAMLWIHKFALAIMSRLDERFPKDDMKILQAMEILNPQKMPEGANRLGGYGNAEIDVIINYYGEASGGVAAAMDGDALRRQWRLFKHTLHTYKQRGVAMRDAFAELLPPVAKHGELPSEIEKLICLKLIMTLNTACCERGFSRMKLIKTYLRNRLYIETLDALMTIALVGPEFVDLSCASDPTLADALVAWESECMRNPSQARFGNKCAAKKKVIKESRTELPVAPSGDNCVEAAGLDELADADEEAEEADDHSGSIVDAHSTPFKTPRYVVLFNELESINEKDLKGQKIAYNFESGWDVGTFKKKYKGKSIAYQGTCQIYFASFKKNYHPKLEVCEYGPTKKWCLVKKKSK